MTLPLMGEKKYLNPFNAKATFIQSTRCGIQRWFADTARGKVCNFAFLTSSGGKFYEFIVKFALVIHPLTMKNRPCALFGHVSLIARIR